MSKKSKNRYEIFDPSGKLINVINSMRQDSSHFVIIAQPDPDGIKTYLENRLVVLNGYVKNGSWTQDEVNKSISREEGRVSGFLKNEWVVLHHLATYEAASKKIEVCCKRLNPLFKNFHITEAKLRVD